MGFLPCFPDRTGTPCRAWSLRQDSSLDRHVLAQYSPLRNLESCRPDSQMSPQCSTGLCPLREGTVTMMTMRRKRLFVRIQPAIALQTRKSFLQPPRSSMLPPLRPSVGTLCCKCSPLRSLIVMVLSFSSFFIHYHYLDSLVYTNLNVELHVSHCSVWEKWKELGECTCLLRLIMVSSSEFATALLKAPLCLCKCNTLELMWCSNHPSLTPTTYLLLSFEGGCLTVTSTFTYLRLQTLGTRVFAVRVLCAQIL